MRLADNTPLDASLTHLLSPLVSSHTRETDNVGTMRLSDWKHYPPSSLPSIPIDAVFCHSYNLTTDRSRLTFMSTGCVTTALAVATERGIPLIIFSNAYDTWLAEARLKNDMARTAGVDPARVRHLERVFDTYDEIRNLGAIISATGGRRIAVVADRDHMPRILYATRLLLHGVAVHPISVRCTRFERTLEPSWVKSVRLGHRGLWILWNVAGYALLALAPRHCR